jgi:hypothetical protein
MKKEKWIAIILGLLMLFSYPFFFLYFIDYRVAGAINNDKLIALILFVPFIIDAVILWGCGGRDASQPKTYRVVYFSNLIVFSTLLILYLLIIFSTGGLNTKNFS